MGVLPIAATALSKVCPRGIGASKKVSVFEGKVYRNLPKQKT